MAVKKVQGKQQVLRKKKSIHQSVMFQQSGNHRYDFAIELAKLFLVFLLLTLKK